MAAFSPYLSLLSSAGITRHNDEAGAVSLLPYLQPLEARRALLTDVSRGGITSAGDLPKLLAEIIKAARRSAAGWLTVRPCGHDAAPIDFDTLSDRDGRWSAGALTDWDRVEAALRSLGHQARHSAAAVTEEEDIVNGAQLLPAVEFLSPQNAVFAGGVALTHDAARRRALGEAAERIVARTGKPHQVFLSSAEELAAAGIRVPSLDAGPQDAYADASVLDWVAANTLDGHAAALPAERALDRYWPRGGLRGFALQHTAGLAAGATLAEAIWAGITECLERDAYWIVMRCRMSCATLDNELVAGAIPGLIEKLARAGLRLVLKDISLDWPLKIVHAVILDESGRIPAFAHGVGSHTSIDKAALKATIECLQTRNGLIRACQELPGEVCLPSMAMKAAPLAWSDPASAPLLSHLFDDAGGTLSRPAPGCPKTVVAEIEHSAGPILWAHLGPFEALQVVRVFVPGCMGPDRTPGSRPARLQTWLDKLKLPYPYDVPILT